MPAYSGYSNTASATTDNDLVSAAQADGASLLYKFDEAAGSIINYGATVGYDIASVSGAVTRQQVGVSGPDLKSLLFSATDGAGAPSYGHAQGTHPSLQGNLTFSMEIVVTVPTGNAGSIVHMNTGDGFTSADFSVDSGLGLVRAGVGVIGSLFNSQAVTGSGGVSSAFRHIVATWNGTTFKGYYQGAEVFSVAIGGGGNGIYNPSSTVLAVGGEVNVDANNVAANIDFLAIYLATVISPAQVTAHFAVSGC